MPGTKTAVPPPQAAVAERPATDRGVTVAVALCIVTILPAVLDSNILSFATVPIVRDLDPVHGVDRIPWLITAYQLAATAALPLYGKLCDSVGSKTVFIGALATFLTGSALCGMAQSMGELIAARAFQGIGGGGLMSVTMVVLHQLGAGLAAAFSTARLLVTEWGGEDYAWTSPTDAVFACATGVMVLALLLSTRLPGTRSRA